MKTLITAALLAGFILSASTIVMGPLNQDEGWYLLAGLNTAFGMMPYRDYLFTQGPVLPYVYAMLSPLWSPFGVLGGRLVTSILGLLLAAFCSGFAYRVAPERNRVIAALLTWLLTACCPVFSYFTAIPKTYSLSGLFIGAAFFLLAGRKSWRFEISGVLLALAAGTRLSLGILLAVVGFGLLSQYRREGYRKAWFRFGIGGGITLAVLFIPFVVSAPEGLIFSQSYHASRIDSGLFKWFVLRIGFFSRLIQGYFMTVAVAVVAVAVGFRDGRRIHPVLGLAALGFLAVTVVHCLSPFPYDDYQTPIMPLAAALASVMLATALEAASSRQIKATALSATVAAMLFIVASPLCMSWVTIRQDRFWFEMKTTPDVIKLREVGAWLREHSAPGDQLLTQDAYLAVEAGLKVLPGLEMGPFSIFPALDDVSARKYQVHNVATLQRAIEASEGGLAALSGYSFAVSCPTTEKMDSAQTALLYQAVESRYEKVESIPNFGQGYTTLDLYKFSNRKTREE